MSEKVDFRYSDVDYAAYLLTIGYEYTYIEVVRDNRTRKLKGFIHFYEDKEELLSLYNEYRNEQVVANVVKLKNNRKKLTKLINSEILRHQANSL